MAETMAPKAEKLQYQTEVRQLLDILAHSLYAERAVFLRELISNASDALNLVQFEMLTNDKVASTDSELAIYLIPDEDSNTLTIKDTGIGMNREEMVENLGTIAHSGARAFLDQAKGKKADLEEIIGRFGVGFYSVFMVAEEVQVTSRSMRPEETAWTWISRGDSEYEILPSDKETRGTEIQIRLKDGEEFASAWRLEDVVKTHSDYVSFPIYLVEPVIATEDDDLDDTSPAEVQADGSVALDVEAESESAERAGDLEAPKETSEFTERQINRQVAIWRQNPNEVKAEEYEQFFSQMMVMGGEALFHVHLVTDTPVDIRSLIFVPAQRRSDLFDSQRDEGVRLYSRKILIQKRNKDLLPEYMRFVEGVVDSEDLPLNVSRETIQEHPMTGQISKTLAGRVLRELGRLANKNEEKYANFWSQYGMFIKGGLSMDFERRDTIVDLLRFESTKSEGKLTSLDSYIERMPASQKSIYYVLGQDLNAAKRSPHLDYFNANKIEVLYFSDPIADTYVLMGLMEHKGHKLVNVDGADVDVPEQSSEEEADAEEKKKNVDPNLQLLIDRMKKVIGDQVEDIQVSRLLVQNACRLVFKGEEMTRTFERMSALMHQDVPESKRVLEINPDHELVKGMVTELAERPMEPLLDLLIEQMLDNARLQEDMHPDPAAMTDRIQAIMQAATKPSAT